MNQAEIKINFTDKKEDYIRKTIDIKKAEEYTQEIFNEIKNKVKEKYKEKEEEKENNDILAGHITINFKQDSEEILGKLSRFLKSIKDAAITSKLDKESYYELQKKALRMKMKF